jgi:hypothetical protein
MGRLGQTAALAIAIASAGAAGRARPRCGGEGPAIVVDTRASRLGLCEAGRLVKDYAVAVGRGGTGKSDEGDGKTPLGRYPLGAPRPSKKFGVFIPIGYPTDEQRKHGARGGDVGIHGPKRGFAWAGRMNTWFNWTRGCIAVASDLEIRAIAAWVKQNRAAVIRID